MNHIKAHLPLITSFSLELMANQQPESEINPTRLARSDEGVGVHNGTSRVNNTMFGDWLVRLDEGDAEHKKVKDIFFRGMRTAERPILVAIHKASDTIAKQTREQTFKLHSEAMAARRDGVANMRLAWYTSSKDRIDIIFSHGFLQHPVLYGLSVPLLSNRSRLPSYTKLDKDGIRHVVLCHVVLGKMEEVARNSKQRFPSTTQFDSGVDNLASPNLYFIWSTNMNTHILPEFVISFRHPYDSNPFLQNHPSPQIPSTSRQIHPSTQLRNPSLDMKDMFPAMFPFFLLELSKVVPNHTMELINNCYRDFEEGKKTGSEVFQFIADVAESKAAPILESIKARQGKMVQLRLNSEMN